jgi:hypothetical protein
LIAEKLIKNLEVQLQEKKTTISLSSKAYNWLAHNGYDPLMGARPMANLIQSQIKIPLSQEILFGQLTNGGHVTVDVINEGQLDLHYGANLEKEAEESGPLAEISRLGLSLSGKRPKIQNSRKSRKVLSKRSIASLTP